MSLCAKMKKLKICRLEFSHPDSRKSIDNLMIIDAFLFFCPGALPLIVVHKSNLQSGSKHGALYIFQKMIFNEIYSSVMR